MHLSPTHAPLIHSCTPYPPPHPLFTPTNQVHTSLDHTLTRLDQAKLTDEDDSVSYDSVISIVAKIVESSKDHTRENNDHSIQNKDPTIQNKHTSVAEDDSTWMDYAVSPRGGKVLTSQVHH